MENLSWDSNLLVMHIFEQKEPTKIKYLRKLMQAFQKSVQIKWQSFWKNQIS